MTSSDRIYPLVVENDHRSAAALKAAYTTLWNSLTWDLPMPGIQFGQPYLDLGGTQVGVQLDGEEELFAVIDYGKPLRWFDTYGDLLAWLQENLPKSSLQLEPSRPWDDK